MKAKINCKRKIWGLNENLFIFLLFLSVLYGLPYFEIIGEIAIISILSLIFVRIIVECKLYTNKIAVYVIVFVLYNICIFLRNINFINFRTAFLQIIIMGFIYNFTTSDIEDKSLIRISNFCKVFALIILLYNFFLKYVYCRIMGINFESYPYALRGVCFAMFLISTYALSKKKVIMYDIIYIITFSIMKERTLVIACLLYLIVLMWLSVERRTKRKNIYFYCFLCLICILPILYVKLTELPQAHQLNLLIAEYTGKNLFSGRQNLWKEALYYIQNKFLFGYGFNEFQFSYLEKNMSVHSTFIYFALQGGMINVILLMIFFILLWKRVVHLNNNYYCQVSCACIITVIFIADFGLLLFANNILYSIFLWLAIGLGQMRIRKKDENSKKCKIFFGD